MSEPEHARVLLSRARADLLAARNMLDPKAFDDGIFGFHIQQAAEKSLKAWLSSLGKEYPYRHDLDELFDAIGEPARPYRALADYTPYALQLRYEDPLPETLPHPRQEAVRLARALVESAAQAVG